jgi:hypothetical protein
MVVFFLFALIIAFILYFTMSEVLSDLKKAKLNRNKRYQSVLKLVSAGSPEKEYSEATVCLQRNFFVEDKDEKEIDASKYKLLVVDGNSMSRFKINDGQIVFVDCEEIFYSQKYLILVLQNIAFDKNKIKYKLRKFIDFYYCKNDSAEKFNFWIENHPELNAEKLRLRYAEAKDVITVCNHLGCRLLISETTRNGEPYYSFHPESCIYGAVKYGIPKENVEIIEKR